MPRTSVSRVVRAPRQALWSLLSEVTRAPEWNKAWTGIELTGALSHGKGTRFRATTDRDEHFDFEVCGWIAPEHISFCPLRDPLEQMYSITLESHTFDLKALGDDETEVTITAHATSHGLRGRVIAMFFWSGHQQDGLELALDYVQGVFEPEVLVAMGDEPETQPE